MLLTVQQRTIDTVRRVVLWAKVPPLSKTADTDLDNVFEENASFTLTFIVKSLPNRNELVSTPDKH